MLTVSLHLFRGTGLAGLNSLQGRDSVVVELLKHMEGVGLLDAYVVSVDHRQESIDCADCWDGTDHKETAIKHWVRLDGSNPRFADIENTNLHENVMQVSMGIALH